jgi:hypothetical protein
VRLGNCKSPCGADGSFFKDFREKSKNLTNLKKYEISEVSKNL